MSRGDPQSARHGRAVQTSNFQCGTTFSETHAMSSCSLGGSGWSSRESLEAMALAHVREAKASALRDGRRAGRRWAQRQASGKELKRLEKLRDWCEGKETGWWKKSFEYVFATEGPKQLTSRL